MLTRFPEKNGASAVWLDLLSPTDAERREVEEINGAPIPDRAALSEIESSSRLRADGDVLTLSVPSTAPRPHGEAVVSPVGFVLSPDRIVTVRYAPLNDFDAIHKKYREDEGAATSSLEVFVTLCEEIVDKIADGLEVLAGDLAEVSTAAFHTESEIGRRLVRSNEKLRVQLRGLGRTGDRLSEMRDSLLGLGRVSAYVDHATQAWPDHETVGRRLASVAQDIASLSDYENHLANKVQFLLDAMVGLIGIAQNDIFKVLTIVSIVGIPPTLVASLYGMNFHGMPELTWRYGYEYGLAMIVISAVIPIVWFKVNGWF
ncbi:MAG: magnesium transporter CorA family protein [Caulobacteraceae bacterium]